MSHTSQKPRGLRSDAERNRDRMLDAARTAFRELGAEAPMIEIARRAGLGTATLYRRFPTREDLLAAVFSDRLTGCDDSARAALENPRPWDGLVEHITHLTSMQLEDRAFTAVFLYEFPPDSPVNSSRQAAGENLRQLLDAAKASGDLRGDVTAEDILVLLKAHDGVVRWAKDTEAESQRFIDRFLSGLHV
ncbi:AcrR family transcriptional regulator [Kibdelosporangium banguiense]|uniref:AcrR family transcriptional regulator n=1 Tax=Kibdelosporangium banguiense TaxID=1365924 RepID=A0ABS4T7M0_9PSEU|nr:TetR/AcrR family transcriptional regulator [Kibdelosporangium banguiense]MBP2320427.1 AcrR family transcriptional regulator [Kibdelosporangium banguiense]